METYQEYIPRALDILARVPLIDGHNDFAHLIRGYYDSKLDGRFEPQNNLVGHVDLKRLLKGRPGGVFWSAYMACPPDDDDFSDEAHYETLRDTMQQIDLIHRLIDRYEDKLELVSHAKDIMEIFQRGKVPSMIGVEGLHQIGNSSSVLRNYHRLGVRYVTLAHAKNNLYADSATSKAPFHKGLSKEGRAMIREMNRIGMLIDLSHVSEDVMVDALNDSIAPVAFTHSCAVSLVPHPRNVSDHCLDRLAANKGIIMVSLIPKHINADASASSITDVVDHIEYIASRIGYSHIGLGSDFDGMPQPVQGVKDVGDWPNLVAVMLGRGIKEEDIEKILGLNIIRVLEEVEHIAKTKGKALPVLEDKVKQLWDDDFRASARSQYPDAQHDHKRDDDDRT